MYIISLPANFQIPTEILFENLQDLQWHISKYHRNETYTIALILQIQINQQSYSANYIT